jgi:hypothetical protein
MGHFSLGLRGSFGVVVDDSCLVFVLSDRGSLQEELIESEGFISFVRRGAFLVGSGIRCWFERGRWSGEAKERSCRGEVMPFG